MKAPQRLCPALSILIVEDEKAASVSLSLVITRKYPNVTVFVAENGKSGVELYEKHLPDIVITDINMPGMDGIQMAGKIRELNPRAKIIAATAKSETHYLLDAIKISINRYVLKPIDLKMLFEAVDDCIVRIIMELQNKEQNDFIRKLSLAVEQSTNMVIISNVRGTIEYVNRKFTTITEYTAEEIIGQNLRIIMANASLPDTFEMLWNTISRGFEWQGELISRKKGGEFFSEEVSISALANEDGVLTHFVAVMQDISERKQAEEKIRGFHYELEKQVKDRTEDLARSNMQLTLEIEERKRAEESLQSTYSEIKQLKDQLQAENVYLQQEVSRQFNFGEIIGKSKIISNVFKQVEQVAPMDATVLLLGETGTGKGVLARAIHSSSARKNRPLITVNCTTLPAALIESELFGREKGAFTGAHDRQMGRFELANGGTIFLDEIGELPLDLQCKLLRVLQDGEFERLGNSRTIKTDVRIIAATNRDLAAETRNGRFREDLYYRLNVFPITLPPLRQRKEDIPLLVNHFVAKFNKKSGKSIETVSKDTMSALQEYHWPGNVRELESVIERAVITSQGRSLQVLDRFDSILQTGGRAQVAKEEGIKALSDLESEYILQVLKKTGWRIEGEKGAAVVLGLNASTLRARMRKYGLARE